MGDYLFGAARGIDHRPVRVRGQTLYLQGRFGEAAAEFEAAFEAQPFAAFLYNAGISYENGGDLSRAIEFFRRYLTSPDPDVDDRAEVEGRIPPPEPPTPARRSAKSVFKLAQGKRVLGVELAGVDYGFLARLDADFSGHR